MAGGDRLQVENASYGLTLCAECASCRAARDRPAEPGDAGPALIAVAVVPGTETRCCRAAAAASSCLRPAARACSSTPPKVRHAGRPAPRGIRRRDVARAASTVSVPDLKS